MNVRDEKVQGIPAMVFVDQTCAKEGKQTNRNLPARSLYYRSIGRRASRVLAKINGKKRVE